MTTESRPPGPPSLLSVRNLAKRFGPTTALAGADLDVRDREIVGLAGQSGAGKSTLLGVIAGLHRYDEGEIVFRGYPINLQSRRDGIRIGIAFVPQDARLLPDLSVYDNIVLPSFGRANRMEPPDLRKRIGGLLAAFGAGDELRLDGKARHLTPAQSRLVTLARALAARAKLYLFDEPFASLAPREIEGLVGVMMRLRMSGCGLVVAARHPDEILPFADRVTVLSEGRTVLAANPHSEEERSQLIRTTAPGGGGPRPDRAAPRRNAAPLLIVNHLAAPPGIADVSLTVGAGEIVALHGLKASGCAAVLRAVVGLQPRSGGGVDVAGSALEAGDPRAGVRAGLAFAGRLVLPAGTARDNILLRAGSTAAAGEALADLWHILKLAPDGLDRPLDAEPLGVRRKVALACALMAPARVVVVDDPTRGLSPSDRAAVHAALRAAAHGGRAILLACPDRDDVLAIADRCVVLCGGRSVADLSCPMLDAEAMALLAASPAAMARNAAVLTELTRENGGAAFWALRRDAHVICLNTAIADAAADPGLRAPATTMFEATRIASALSRGEAEFVAEPDGSRKTLLVPIQSRRGRPLGLIGLTLGRDATPPPAAAVAFRVATLAASL